MKHGCTADPHAPALPVLTDLERSVADRIKDGLNPFGDEGVVRYGRRHRFHQRSIGGALGRLQAKKIVTYAQDAEGYINPELTDLGKLALAQEKKARG